MDLLRSDPRLLGDLGLSAATRQSTSCRVASGETPRGPTRAVSVSEARAASWRLGMSLGTDAMIRQIASADAEVLEPRVAHMSQISEALGVPAPAVFVPRQMVYAIREFTQFVEADGSQTAHQLAVRYSP